VSVVAIEGTARYSVQVEANVGTPDFLIAYVDDDLALEGVLEALEKHARERP
jgi:hypothetical protein